MSTTKQLAYGMYRFIWMQGFLWFRMCPASYIRKWGSYTYKSFQSYQYDNDNYDNHNYNNYGTHCILWMCWYNHEVTYILLINIKLKRNSFNINILVFGVIDQTAVTMMASQRIMPVNQKRLFINIVKIPSNVDIRRAWSATQIETNVIVLTWSTIIGRMPAWDVCLNVHSTNGVLRILNACTLRTWIVILLMDDVNAWMKHISK